MSKERFTKLIVNADDFGMSPFVNDGIREVLGEDKLVRGTSLMVDGPAASEAKHLKDDLGNIAVGLHFTLTNGSANSWLRFMELLRWPDRRKEEEFTRQVNEFERLMGRLPDHIDGHHHVHRLRGFSDIVDEYARKHHIPVRGLNYKPVYGFHGRTWRHGNLGRGIKSSDLMNLVSNLKWGIYEIICHPGYYDVNLSDPYLYQRQLEIATLNDPKVYQFIANNGNIELINQRQILRR